MHGVEEEVPHLHEVADLFGEQGRLRTVADAGSLFLSGEGGLRPPGGCPEPLEALLPRRLRAQGEPLPGRLRPNLGGGGQETHKRFRTILFSRSPLQDIAVCQRGRDSSRPRTLAERRANQPAASLPVPGKTTFWHRWQNLVPEWPFSPNMAPRATWSASTPRRFMRQANQPSPAGAGTRTPMRSRSKAAGSAGPGQSSASTSRRS